MSGNSPWNLCLLPADHPGLTEALAASMCASACVCLHRHHESPTRIEVRHDARTSEHLLHWSTPTIREKNANRNDIEATRDGAYAVALLCLQRHLNLVAVGRAEHGTGADWYVAPPGKGVLGGTPDLDDPYVRRLEIGGHDDRSSLPYELSLKVQQLKAGKSNIEGIATIVGFKRAHVLIQTDVLTAAPSR